MALVLADRVQQTGTSNTTVSFTLSSGVFGYQSFAVVGNGNTTYYTATDASGNWEVGLGTYSTTGPTLARTTIYSSSNSGAAVSSFSGVVTVWCDYPAERAVTTDIGSALTVGSSLTFNQAGTGTSGTFSYNGSAPYTISYNTVGSPSTSGANATGTWPIAISGNATSATNATTANNAITAGGFTPTATSGTANRIVVADVNGYINNTYFSSTDSAISTGVTGIHVKQGTNLLYTSNAAGVATFLSGSTMNIVGTSTNVTGIVAVANGGTGNTTNTASSVPASGVTGVLAIANGGTGNTTNTAANIAGGVAGAIPYQSATGTTGFSAAGTAGQVLTSQGTGIPTWSTITGTGTVTSVAQTFTGGLISVAGSPITSAGTLALTVAGTQWGIPYFNTATSWTATAAGTTGQAFIATTGAAPTWGTLGVAGGGLGVTTVPANGSIPIGNGTTYTNAQITAGVGLRVTVAAGSITLANTQVPGTITTATTITVSITTSQYNITALATGTTFLAPAAGADGQKLTIRIKDNGTAQTLAWTVTSGGFRAIGVTLPTTTVVGVPRYVACVYNAQDLFWDVLAVA